MKVIFIKEFYVEEFMVSIPVGQEGELIDDTRGIIEFRPPCIIGNQVNPEFESFFIERLCDYPSNSTIDMVEGVQPSFYITCLK